MTTNTKTLDPVQGLVDYILEIKPYHTKIVEVLVEYIQVDPINVTVTENIDLCINLGIPNVDSRYIFPILGVDTIANTFTVSGDQTPSLFVGMVTQVFGSTLNDNKYTITSTLFDGTNTIIWVSSNIPDTTIDGQIVHNAIEYCPDSNLYGTNIVPQHIEENCSGGFGEVYDSYTPIYDIVSVDDTVNQITIAGDYSAEFVAGVQLQLEYVTTTAGSPPVTTINSLALTIQSVTVDNTIPTAPLTIITSEQNWSVVGSPAVFDNGVVYITNVAYDVTDINEGTSINTFTIAGDYTTTFDRGTLIEIKFSDGNDGVYFVIQVQLVDGDTVLYVSQNVPFPEASRKGQLLFRPIGFDEQVYCSTTPESRIDVIFDERIEFGNLQLDFQDNIMAYNLENTDGVPYGGVPYGTILSSTEPTIIESDTAPSPSGSPLSIPLFTFWLDQTLSTGSPITVTSAVMKQWNGLRWVGITTAYWVDSDTDQMYQRIYRVVDGTTIDTGWVEVNSLGVFGGTEIFGASEIEPIAVQHYSASATGSPVTGQTTYTLGTAVPGTDSELLSVTINGLPAGFTLDSATVFTITSPTINVGDWIVATVKDRTGIQSNVLIAGFSSEPHIVFHGGTYSGGSPLENVVTPQSQTHSIIISEAAVGSPTLTTLPGFKISGNQAFATAFQPGDTFTVSGTASSDGTYTVAAGVGEYVQNEPDEAVLVHTLDNPSSFGTATGDKFGWSVDISGDRCIVGSKYEDYAGGLDSGKAYIYDVITGALIHTLDNPNEVGSPSDNDYFGDEVAIDGNYCIVGAKQEDDAGGLDSGKAYIFNVTTGALIHTLDNPNAYGTSVGDRFGNNVDIHGNYCIVAAEREDDSSGLGSGKAYIFNVTTGALVHTLDNPNESGSPQDGGDSFGRAVAIEGTYCLVGAFAADDANGIWAGKAYIFDVISGSLLFTLDDPNPHGTSEEDYFGDSVSISGDYCIIGAYGESDAGGKYSGKAYIYNVTTGELIHTIDNPNPDAISASDWFGGWVGISGNYCVVGAYGENDGAFDWSGKAYIFNVTTGALVHTIDNPNAFGTPAIDYFAVPAAISGKYCIMGATFEDGPSGVEEGKAYIFAVAEMDEFKIFTEESPADAGVGGTITINDTYEIYGGNFAYHFFGGTKFEGYDDAGLLGQWQATTFPVVAVGSTSGSPVLDTMSILGNNTRYFTTGTQFYVDHTLTNKGWFTIVSSTYDGTNTVIVVDEEVVNASFSNGVGSPITPIVQNYSKDLGTIQGALFDPDTQKTIVIPQTTGNVNVDRITYQWIGPLRIDVDMLPTDFLSQTTTGNVEMSGELIGSANFINIVNADTTLDTFTVLGDQTLLLPAGITFQVQDSYNDGGSPPITNDGSWTVDYSFYNGAGVVEIVSADAVADTFTISGNYTGKFIPGFDFIVSGSGSPTNDDNYTVLTPGATYNAGSDTTTIPVTTQVPNTIVDGGSPYPTSNGSIIFSGTDETLIFIVGDVVTEQQPFGRIINLQSSTGTQVSGQITDELQFGWTVDDWFQYPILSVDLTDNTITVVGDARGDLQIGQDFEILGAYDTTGSPPNGSPPGITNNGIYKVRIDEDYRNGSPIRSEVDFDGVNTTITVYPDLETTSIPYGFIEPDNDAQAVIAFSDVIGVVAVETADAVVLQTGGSLIDSWDYPFWDVGSFDENLGTVIHLYSGTFE